MDALLKPKTAAGPTGANANTTSAKAPGFIDRLEALRGVAAMIVSSHHAFLILPVIGWQQEFIALLQVILDGRAAVTIFFVLSGFVLGLSLRRGGYNFGSATLQFYLRRGFRIYPAFLVSTAFIVLYLLVFHKETGIEHGYWFERFYGSYHQPVSLHQIIRNLLFRSDSLNGVAWTLRVEMECSLLLPFLHWISTRLSLRQNILLLVAMPVLGIPFKAPGAFLYMFFAGYLLPVVAKPLFLRLRHMRWGTACTVCAAIVLLLGSRGLMEENWWINRLGFITECFGAWWLIGALLYGPEFTPYRLLDLSIVRFYGRISYSFYVWHFFLLFLVSQFAFQHFPQGLISGWPITVDTMLWAASTLVATLIASVSYRMVERPFIRLSKTICSHVMSRSTFIGSRSPSEVSPA